MDAWAKFLHRTRRVGPIGLDTDRRNFDPSAGLILVAQADIEPAHSDRTLPGPATQHLARPAAHGSPCRSRVDRCATTKTGLKVESALDTRTYQKGIKVRKAAMKCLDITGDQFHPEWSAYDQLATTEIVPVILLDRLTRALA